MTNNTQWIDTSGAKIQAHGGCIIEYSHRYYWYGENKSGPTLDGGVDFIGFSCYSSDDLSSWQNEGLVLCADNSDNSPLSCAIVAERPAVIYNVATKQFVMWFHYDTRDYRLAKAGCAVAAAPTGPFVFKGAEWPNGRESRDINLFKDKNGKAYMLSSSDWNSSLLIHELTDDYLSFTGAFRPCFIEQYREAPAVFYQNGLYYMVSSGCTGWAPNAMLYATSENMLGNWRLRDNPCSGKAARNTFYAQSADIFTVNAKPYLLADHWDEQNLSASRYSILPVHADGLHMDIPWQESCAIL